MRDVWKNKNNSTSPDKERSVNCIWCDYIYIYISLMGNGKKYKWNNVFIIIVFYYFDLDIWVAADGLTEGQSHPLLCVFVCVCVCVPVRVLSTGQLLGVILIWKRNKNPYGLRLCVSIDYYYWPLDDNLILNHDSPFNSSLDKGWVQIMSLYVAAMEKVPLLTVCSRSRLLYSSRRPVPVTTQETMTRSWQFDE